MPVLVAGERRDDRHLAADEDRVEQVAAQPDDRGDEPEVRDALGDEQAAVDAGQADGVDAEVAQAGDELAVDDAPEDRGGDLERRPASVTRRPPSKRVGTPRRSSHSVMRLPPPWTRTTGRRRATAATSARTCALVGDASCHRA